MKRLIPNCALILLISLSLGCATNDETPKEMTPATGGNNDGEALTPKPAKEECSANDLLIGTSVLMTYDPGVAPTPKGGALPTGGTYDLIDWTVYGTEEGEAVERAATYRFGAENTVDASFAGIQGSMTWTTKAQNLFLTVTCPSSLKDQVQAFEYTVANDTVTLFSDDGVQVLKKR